MNKYAELNKIATLYIACRGILRVKLAAAAASTTPKTAPATSTTSTGTTTPPASTTTTPAPGTGGTPYPAGTTGGIVPPKQPKRQSWGEWFQDMLDWGNDQVQNNGSLVTKEQQAEADRYNAQQHQEAMQSLANGEYNGWDPSQQVRAGSIQTEDAVKKENADGNNGNGGNAQNITINNNIPEGYGGGGGGGYGYASEGGGGGQQFQSSPSFYDYINQYSQYRRQTA